MSRTIKNRGLAKLCALHDYQIADLACICRCHRFSITLYADGVKPLPDLEPKLAAALHLTVPALRRELGLDRAASTHNPNGGPHDKETHHAPGGSAV
ncbi:MAG: hypothetical protein ABII76_15575, partial [Pseudomonadota bacterium]